ncbi:sigma-70 family RNA polymerase sigma factor [Asanoa sp. NPDC049573]|uniref:sigma-70 family RNA polymerase sigma factor n=1 Tax=Asanoa sp. NPDC049573 TaxID=3155396 RepID=UPI003447A26F
MTGRREAGRPRPTGGDEIDELDPARFEELRPHLRAVAYRMLGSLAEADDAVQEAWLRLRTGGEVRDLRAWLTTVVARVCLDVLRARRRRPTLSADAPLPDPLVLTADAPGPEETAVREEAIGVALLVVLDTLAPAERVAFVLHDLFGVPFEEVGPVVGRTPVAARQLASRARRRVRGATAHADTDRVRQRAVVDAFLAAARGGDLAALVALLDPDVRLRADVPAAFQGADAVAGQAAAYAAHAAGARPAWVDGAAGLAVFAGGRPVTVLAFTVAAGRITEIFVYARPDRWDVGHRTVA